MTVNNIFSNNRLSEQQSVITEQLAEKIKTVTLPLQITMHNLVKVSLWHQAAIQDQIKLFESFHQTVDGIVEQARSSVLITPKK